MYRTLTAPSSFKQSTIQSAKYSLQYFVKIARNSLNIVLTPLSIVEVCMLRRFQVLQPHQTTLTTPQN